MSSQKRGVFLRSMWKVSTAQVALSGVLSAVAVAIPLVFRGTPLQIYIPAIQYSGTAASHVPSMIAIMVGPSVSALVGLASTIGFLATLGPVIAARAFIHVLFGVAASIFMLRGGSYVKALYLVALPIHVLGEGLVVYALGPMFGVVNVLPLAAGLSVSLGTAIHHVIDSAISLAVYRVARPMLLPLLPKSNSLRL